MDVAEEESRKAGWENLAQQEYFTNLDKYEDLSFIGDYKPQISTYPQESTKTADRSTRSNKLSRDKLTDA